MRWRKLEVTVRYVRTTTRSPRCSTASTSSVRIVWPLGLTETPPVLCVEPSSPRIPAGEMGPLVSLFSCSKLQIFLYFSVDQIPTLLLHFSFICQIFLLTLYPTLISDFLRKILVLHYNLNITETEMTERQVILTDQEALVGQDLELSFRAVRSNQAPAGVLPRLV